MNYNDFIKALGDLHHDAEFCLMDVSERISVGDKTVEFSDYRRYRLRQNRAARW